MEILVKLVRWLAGLALGVIAYGALDAGDTVPFILILTGALVVLPPIGALVGRFVAPVARHGVAIGLGFALVIAGLAVAGLGDGRRPASDGAEGIQQAAD